MYIKRNTQEWFKNKKCKHQCEKNAQLTNLFLRGGFKNEITQN
jgi:hypothetical protein